MQELCGRFVALAFVFVSAGSAAAQAAPERSTLTAVYTAAQASKGEDTFTGICKSCHSPADYTLPAFTGAWAGKPLFELYSFISQNMPKNEPGTLSAAEYTQVIAYLLKLNGMPAGDTELPADSIPLKSIRFELPVKKQ